jgi:hypothetical protein
MDLAKLIVPISYTTIDYPGYPGFEVSLAYLTKDELMKLRDKCTTQKLDRKSRQMKEEVDNDLFQEVYIAAIVKGWKGLKYKYLKSMIPVDLSDIPKEEFKDGNGELDYNSKNAELLMKNGVDFDNWVTSVLEDVENFTKDS